MAKLKPESRVVVRSFWAGLGGLTFIGFLLYLTFSAQTGNPFSTKNYIKAVFHDTHALQGKDPVRQNSKGIGRVTAIDYRNGAAVVTLQIEQGGDYKVYNDATAYIGDTSAIGSKFVGINPGTPAAGPLQDNTIPESRTRDSRDLYQVLNIFDPKTRTSTQGFLQQFGGGLAGHADGFTDFVHTAAPNLTGLGTISAALASKEADLPALLDASDQLSSHLRSRAGEIASLINQTDTTFRAISVDGGAPLSSILQKAPATLDQVKVATDSLNDPLGDTQVAMDELEPGAKGLGDSNDDLRGTFRDALPVFDKAPDVARKTAPAFEDLTPTAKDLQPLAPRVTEFTTRLATPLSVLAPYAKEVGYLFVRGNSFVSEGAAPGVHYAYFNASAQGPYTVAGSAVRQCQNQVDEYPRPGQADHDRTKLGLNNEAPCGVQAQGLGGR
jgi:phospholipid/cholesterol/gamma-HCH transport system substrate-binding protein